MASGAAMSGRETGVIAGRVRGAKERLGVRERADDLARGGVLLTGATGFVGMELLARYLERTERRVYALVRGADATRRRPGCRHAAPACSAPTTPMRSAWSRFAATSRARSGPRGRRDALAEAVSEIVHGAASVSFELGLEASRAINVEGTRRMLEFAERCQRAAACGASRYISTAYVAGDHAGLLQRGRPRRRPELSQRLRAVEVRGGGACGRVARRLPITVLRPSIIVGERDSGWTARSTCSTGRCARLRAAPTGAARTPRRARRRGTGRLRRRRDLRASARPARPRASPFT